MQRDLEQGQAPLDPYERFVQERPAEAMRVQQLVDEGRVALESGEGERARGLFMRALAIFPWVPAALTNLAALALQRNEPEQAWRYLTDLFARFPDDPSGNGVAVRYWLGRSSTPMAYFHAQRALAGLAAQKGPARAKSDSSARQRAAIILLSTFAAFDGDDLICDLYSLAYDCDWDATALLTFGIAFYNRGDLAQAEKLWLACADDERAVRYLTLLRWNKEGVVPPFRLDYHLGARMPTLDELREILQARMEGAGPLRSLAVLPSRFFGLQREEGEPFPLFQALRYAASHGIPSLAVLDGIRDILSGEEEQAELAMGLLFMDRWPHLGELLRYTVSCAEISLRVRLGAVLYLLWIEGFKSAQEALSAVGPKEDATELDRLLISVVGLQVAIVGGDAAAAGQALDAAQRHLEAAGAEGEEWRPLLEELTAHYEKLTGKSRPSVEPEPERTVDPARRPVPDNVILFPIDRDRRG